MNLTRKALHIVIGVLFFSLWFGGACKKVTGKKMYRDAKVLELCAKDGGAKVYETVELPAGLVIICSMATGEFYKNTLLS